MGGRKLRVLEEQQGCQGSCRGIGPGVMQGTVGHRESELSIMYLTMPSLEEKVKIC